MVLKFESHNFIFQRYTTIMSDPQFPVNIEQALIDSSVETTILQAFLTGK